MKNKYLKRAWKVDTDNPKLDWLIDQVLWKLDPMGTGCVENKSYDEYSALAGDLYHDAINLYDTVYITAEAFEEAVTRHFSAESVDSFMEVVFSGVAEHMLTTMGIGTVVFDTTLPEEIQNARKLSKAEVSGAITDTLEEFKDSVESTAYSVDEFGVWAVIHNGDFYSIASIEDPRVPAPGATHALWWGA